jgi:hypothetical protein
MGRFDWRLDHLWPYAPVFSGYYVFKEQFMGHERYFRDPDYSGGYVFSGWNHAVVEKPVIRRPELAEEKEGIPFWQR